MITLLFDLRKTYPAAWAAWLADVRARYADIPGLNNAAVSPETVRLFAAYGKEITPEYFLDRMQQREGSFLLWPDMERLALVNSFYPEGVTLQTILK